jgi:hypothetical protein
MIIPPEYNKAIQKDHVPAKNPCGFCKKGRLSGLRLILLAAPSPKFEWQIAAFVPDHGSGWHAAGFHHLSF